MRTIDIEDVQAEFAMLLEEARKGASIVVAKAGKPIAKVIPPDPEPQPRGDRLGFYTQDVKIPDDFDTMAQAEIEALFYGD